MACVLPQKELTKIRDDSEFPWEVAHDGVRERWRTFAEEMPSGMAAPLMRNLLAQLDEQESVAVVHAARVLTKAGRLHHYVEREEVAAEAALGENLTPYHLTSSIYGCSSAEKDPPLALSDAVRRAMVRDAFGQTLGSSSSSDTPDTTTHLLLTDRRVRSTLFRAIPLRKQTPVDEVCDPQPPTIDESSARSEDQVPTVEGVTRKMKELLELDTRFLAEQVQAGDLDVLALADVYFAKARALRTHNPEKYCIIISYLESLSGDPATRAARFAEYRNEARIGFRSGLAPDRPRPRDCLKTVEDYANMWLQYFLLAVGQQNAQSRAGLLDSSSSS